MSSFSWYQPPITDVTRESQAMIRSEQRGAPCDGALVTAAQVAEQLVLVLCRCCGAAVVRPAISYGLLQQSEAARAR